MSTCRTCGRSFRPSSGHRDCPACRSRDRCACGKTKQKKSRTCLACRPQGGEDGGTWRGGRIRHKAGYVMRWVPDHPRARSNPYVFEHILVMEARLGRPLHADENVHHRNGIKDDNRPENLELWTRPQPTGIRVRDAIEWALAIVDRYGDDPSRY